jgi:ABC transporter DrrB family efflux protein
MTTIAFDATAPVAGRSRVVGALADTAAVMKRNVLRMVRTPQLLVFALVQQLVFLVLFRYVFGGSIDVSGLAYVDYLIPGILAIASLFDLMATAVGYAEDSQRGFLDRMRSLPMAPSAAVLGHGAADLVRQAGMWLVVLGAGFAVGFRPHGGTGGLVAACGLCMAFAFAMSWAFAWVGLTVRNSEATQAALMPVFPLTFVSSAYIRIETMPGWLQPFARNQPVSQVVNAVRGLTQGSAASHLLEHSTQYYVGTSLVWCVVIMAVFAPLAVRRYRQG